MRIKVLLTKTEKELPIQNQSIVNSFIHRVLGKDNPYHDSKNNYSISSLMGGKWIKGTDKISFNKGGFIIISSLDKKFLDDIMLNLYTTPFYSDITVCGIEFIEEKLYNGWNHFATLSPFLIKEYKSKKEYSFLTLNDENFEIKVKNYLLNKLIKIDPTLDLTNFDVKIGKRNKNKIKKIWVKNVVNKANQCQVSVLCNKKVANILYNIGLGQSTGSGFGTIYKTENHDLYRYDLKNNK